MYNFVGVLTKFWKIFMKRGKSAFMYNLINSVFFFFKKIFRIKIFFSINKKFFIYHYSKNSVNFFPKTISYLAINPNFIFFHLLEHSRPAVILSSRLIRGDLKRIPFFFEIDLRAYSKVFRWLKEVIKLKNSLFFLLPQRLLLELILLYKHTSSIFLLKKGIHQDLLTTRPNLRFLHHI